MRELAAHFAARFSFWHRRQIGSDAFDGFLRGAQPDHLWRPPEQGAHPPCVDVCPTDAFREGPNFLVIDPDECIDCALCVPECPVDAIFAEDDVPPDQRAFTPLNVELAKIWKPIIAMKPVLPDAEEWARVKNKMDQLKR